MSLDQQSKILDDVQQIDDSTCQSAAICRVIGSTDVAKVRSDLLNIGCPGDPDVMGHYLVSRVREYKWLRYGSIHDAIDGLANGYQIITHGYTTHSGHVIGLSGYDSAAQVFIAEDPYGEFDFPSWSFTGSSGNNARYSVRAIWCACVAGASCDDAYQLYSNRVEPDWAQKNMWIHLIKN